MRRLTLSAALLLFVSGCTYREVNEYSLFKYRSDDHAGDIALKTAGNLVPWTAEAVVAGAAVGIYGAFYLGIAYVQSQRSY